jgi:cardiolipin synthase A/B
VKLLIQPDNAATPLLDGIRSAKKSIEIAIFRFDRKDIEMALVDAVKRGVSVQALIAFTNRGGAKSLRGLEARLLASGAVVARTADDLTRYHGKFMIVDRRKLFVLGFNFTRSDIEGARSFGLVITNPKVVQEASRLFAADTTRQLYEPSLDTFLVSPLNARRQLAAFLQDAKRELLIYDPEISDKAMLDILRERAADGVDIRVIGSMKPALPGVPVRASHPLRLHVRMAIRDGHRVFLGSQSLRRAELDMRREVGIIFRDGGIAEKIKRVFDKDWESAKSVELPVEKVAKKVAKAVSKDLAPVTPVLEELAEKNGQKLDVDQKDFERTVKEAVKTAVRDAVHEVVSTEISKE